MRNALLAISVVALTGTLLYLPASQQSAQAQVLGDLKASAADNGNLVTLVRRGGGGGFRGAIWAAEAEAATQVTSIEATGTTAIGAAIGTTAIGTTVGA